MKAHKRGGTFRFSRFLAGLAAPFAGGPDHRLDKKTGARLPSPRGANYSPNVRRRERRAGCAEEIDESPESASARSHPAASRARLAQGSPLARPPSTSPARHGPALSG